MIRVASVLRLTRCRSDDVVKFLYMGVESRELDYTRIRIRSFASRVGSTWSVHRGRVVVQQK